MWSDDLIHALEKANLHNYILMEVPEPGNEDEIENWKKDRVAAEEYIRKSVPAEVWTALLGMGWDIKEQNPKTTFKMLGQYFYTDSDETNFLLYFELINMDIGDYDNDFLAFRVRLNYLRDTLSKSGRWRLSKNAATMCALKAVETAYPDLYSRSITEARNSKISWDELMVELKKLSGRRDL